MSILESTCRSSKWVKQNCAQDFWCFNPRKILIVPQESNYNNRYQPHIFWIVPIFGCGNSIQPHIFLFNDNLPLLSCLCTDPKEWPSRPLKQVGKGDVPIPIKNARSQHTRKVVVVVVVVVVFFCFEGLRWIKDLNQTSPVMSVIALGQRNQDLACRKQSEEAGGVGCLGIPGKKLLGVFHLRQSRKLHIFFLVKIKLKGYLISPKFSKNSMVEILIWSLEAVNLTPELLGPSLTKTP